MRVSPKVKAWLTGRDSDPSVRYRYWTEVEGRGPGDARARRARRSIGQVGWAADLLAAEWPDGHWVTPKTGPGDLYRPKYTATNWVAIVLSDLGMTREDPRIRRMADLILDRWSTKNGDLSGTAGEVCVTGNAVRYLVRFGYLDHPKVQRSIAWLLREQKADGGWHCFPSRHGTLDGWEGLAAFAEIPVSQRDPAIARSIERGAEFYLERRLMREGSRRYPPWFRIHYPNHYYYDLLVGLRTLTRLGYGGDRRLGPAVSWLEQRRSSDGMWALDQAHPDLHPDSGYSLRSVVYPMLLEAPGDPSRWATVEALSVLAAIERV